MAVAATVVDDAVYDVIIVGAGPCGLATAARLREHTPAALFTDEEHRRYHRMGKYGRRVAARKHVRRRSGREVPGGGGGGGGREHEYRLLAVDASAGAWLGRWTHLFGTFDIAHLRSPVMWHVDPLDRDALLAHAYAEGREAELVEIRDCVGRETSKRASKAMAGRRACGKKQEARVAINLREQNDYHTPSRSLFCDHCHAVATRYGLESDLVKHETLHNLDYGPVKDLSVDDDEPLFTVTTDAGRRYAKAVVLAVGPANRPEMPHLPSMPADKSLVRQACHSMHIRQFPDPLVQESIRAGRPTNVLVVGGGLTSAQLSDLAIRRGVAKVFHLTRGPLRVKHFDVDLQWMGKYKNAEQARFWGAESDDERLDIIKTARGGGSITPLFHKKLKKHVASGRLEIHERTCLQDAKFQDGDGGGVWAVTTDPPMDNLPLFDFIYFATGIQTSFSSLPYLQNMMTKHPIQERGGLPCLNDHLMWTDGVPLYLTGKLASLKLGPAAPNIGGAKLGAERVAWSIQDRIQPSGRDSDDAHGRDDFAGYLSGHGNMYSALACD